MKSIPLKGTKNAKTIPLKSEHRYATINTCGVPFPDLFKTQFPIVIAYLANNIGLCVKQKFHSFQTLNAKIKFPTFYQRLPDFVQPSPPPTPIIGFLISFNPPLSIWHLPLH